MSEFVAGGAIPYDSRAYIDRAFENEAFAYLTSSQADWVLLLGPRQHGKSSGLRRLAERLKDQGYRVASLDLQSYGADHGYAETLEWLAESIASAVGRPEPTVPTDRRESLDDWLAAALEGIDGSIAVFLDEAAALPDATRRRLYGQLRALYNARGLPRRVPQLARLVFLFAGTFRTEKLIETENSPFNISKVVETTDLTLEDAMALAEVSEEDLVVFVQQAYDLVGGQPYLLQLLLASASGEPDGRQERFDLAVERLRNGIDPHVVSLFERANDDAEARDIVAAMVRDGAVTLNAASTAQKWLLVLGVAGRQDGELRFRNRLYAEVARAAFGPVTGDLEAPTTIGELTPPVTPTIGLRRLTTDEQLFAAIGDPALRTLALEAARAAADAHNSGHHRAALIAYGSALEATLLAHLEALDGTALQAAKTAAGLTPSGRPAEWRLVDLIAIAHKTPALTSAKLHLADATRDWRNFVHPAKARQAPQTNGDLASETVIASETLGIVLRELGR